MPQLCRSRRYSGYSIIEMVVALFIFSTSLLLILGMLPVAYKCLSYSRNMLVATEIAHQEIEYIKSLNWDDITGDNPAFRGRSLSSTSWVNGAPATIRFDSQIVISNYSKDSRTGLVNIKLVTVQVKYAGDGGQKVGATLETLINAPFTDGVDGTGEAEE